MKSKLLKKAFSHSPVKAAFPIAALGFSLTVQAEEAPVPDFSVAYNVGVVSDYRVRGIAQTSGSPALQGGIDLTTKSGFYLGTAASNVKWVKEFNGATKGSYELDLYGGYRAQITDTNFSYDVGVITYRYPGNNSGVAGFYPAGTFTNASTVEIYGDLSYGIYTFKYNRSVGNFLGNLNSSGSQYFDLSAAIDLSNGFTLVPHIGRQLIPNQAGNLGNYSDMSLTLSKDFGNGLSATAAFLTTNASRAFYTDTKGRFLGNNAFVAGLKYTF
ncbi:MAG: TorF family putative porin [Burkholderiales bacterium]|nr:TorF family putative porin [Burkholderiales bacterium]